MDCESSCLNFCGVAENWLVVRVIAPNARNIRGFPLLGPKDQGYPAKIKPLVKSLPEFIWGNAGVAVIDDLDRSLLSRPVASRLRTWPVPKTKPANFRVNVPTLPPIRGLGDSLSWYSTTSNGGKVFRRLNSPDNAVVASYLNGWTKQTSCFASMRRMRNHQRYDQDIHFPELDCYILDSTKTKKHSMINKQKCLFYFVGETPFKSLEDAQAFDIEQLAVKNPVGTEWGEECIKDLSKWILANSTELVDILTTTPTSRLKARKIHGGTKEKKAPKNNPKDKTKDKPKDNPKENQPD